MHYSNVIRNDDGELFIVSVNILLDERKLQEANSLQRLHELLIVFMISLDMFM